MQRVKLLGLLTVGLLPLQSHGAASVESFDLRSARDLVDLCAVAADDPMAEAAHGFCYGFLSGAGDYHRAINAGENPRPLFCLPAKRPSRVETANRYVAWSRANPQHLDEAPVDNLIRFAVATWPCQ
jgi:hypothetical protein